MFNVYNILNELMLEDGVIYGTTCMGPFHVFDPLLLLMTKMNLIQETVNNQCKK